jgi:hypothetical protein
MTKRDQNSVVEIHIEIKGCHKHTWLLQGHGLPKGPVSVFYLEEEEVNLQGPFQLEP